MGTTVSLRKNTQFAWGDLKNQRVAKDLPLSDTRGMKRETGDYRLHVFVCTNEKKKECCAHEGAEDVRKELKEWAKKHPRWRKQIRINASGCMDRCKEGVVVAAYPDNKWFLKVRPKNVDELIEELEKLLADDEKSADKNR